MFSIRTTTLMITLFCLTIHMGLVDWCDGKNSGTGRGYGRDSASRRTNHGGHTGENTYGGDHHNPNAVDSESSATYYQRDGENSTASSDIVLMTAHLHRIIFTTTALTVVGLFF